MAFAGFTHKNVKLREEKLQHSSLKNPGNVGTGPICCPINAQKDEFETKLTIEIVETNSDTADSVNPVNPKSAEYFILLH